MAELLHNAGENYVLSWKTVVDYVAARTFASSLFEYLGGSKDDRLNFKDAYDGALRDLINRGWLLKDPEIKKEL